MTVAIEGNFEESAPMVAPVEVQTPFPNLEANPKADSSSCSTPNKLSEKTVS